MPAPRKGPRLGSGPAHQKQHPGEPRRAPVRVRRRRDHHDPRQGQGPAAVRGEADHEGEEGRRAPAAARRRPHPRQAGGAQAVRRDRTPLCRPQRRATCGSSSSAPAPATPPPWPASNWCSRLTAMTLFDDATEGPAAGEARRRVRRHRVPRVRRPARGPHRRGSPQPGRSSDSCATRRSASTCAGRTDAGVHAWGQVVSFDADPGVDPWRLQSAVNGALAPEVVVREADVVEPDFDARRSACWRAYRYTVVNRPVTDPFLARYAWWVPTPLDRARAAARRRPVRG